MELFIWISNSQHRYLTEHPLENKKLKEIAEYAFINNYDKTVDDIIDIFGKNYI